MDAIAGIFKCPLRTQAAVSWKGAAECFQGEATQPPEPGALLRQEVHWKEGTGAGGTEEHSREAPWA